MTGVGGLLADWTVLVTRPEMQAAGLVARLADLGARSVCLPMISIEPPDDWGPADRAIADLDRFQWVAFTSGNAVRSFVGRATAEVLTTAHVRGLRFATVGPATAAVLGAAGLRVDVVPATHSADALAEALRYHVAGQRVLLPRGAEGRDVLPNRLASVAELTAVTVYRQTVVADKRPEVWSMLRRGEIGLVTLTSPNIARHFVARLDNHHRGLVADRAIRLVTISELTSTVVRLAGLSVEAEAIVADELGLVAAAIRAAHR